MPKIRLTGQFLFFGVCLIGQLENVGKLTKLCRVLAFNVKLVCLTGQLLFFEGQDNFVVRARTKLS